MLENTAKLGAVSLVPFAQYNYTDQVKGGVAGLRRTPMHMGFWWQSQKER
jgi:hypothetical protein